MSNATQLSRDASGALGAQSSLHACYPSHAVQFYETDEFLFEAVARFLEPGLESDDRILVIATEAHRRGIAQSLDHALVEEAVASGRLLFVDARETLAEFMVGDSPDADLFRDTLARLVAPREGARPGVRTRAFGEMVDLLWRDGNAQGALRLEELWNEAGKGHSFALLCAYVMGHFYKERESARFMHICQAHTHVIPNQTFGLLDGDARLREIALLQQRAHQLENELEHRKELEGALREALRERSRVEEELRTSVTREREARTQAEASDAFKEVFLAILGHDLRNPLNTVLTTARLMTMRREVAPESQKRLDRIVASGVRMQRMIEQLLDVARARLAGGIPIERSDERELAPHVERIVDEVRIAHPARSIEIVADGPCVARVDVDRFEQLVSNLVGNAVTHGHPGEPVRVELAKRSGMVCLTVHNGGAPIEPARLPTLFDPFTRGEPHAAGAHGLGLGLYISERIVSAHGGKIAVTSSAEGGTQVEARIPLAP